MLKAMMKAQTVVEAPPTATEEERKNIEAFNTLLLKKKLGQFQGIRRELAMRQRLHRSLTLNDNFSFKIINGNPEVRFRVARPQYRRILVSKIRQELAHKKKARKEKRKIEKERKKMEKQHKEYMENKRQERKEIRELNFSQGNYGEQFGK